MKKILVKLINIKMLIKKNNTKIRSYVPFKCDIESDILISKNIEISNYINKIGAGTYISEYTFINYCESIGRYCSIARNVTIGAGNHPLEYLSTSPFFYSSYRGYIKKDIYSYVESDKKAIIKNDVWIGNGAIIMNGITIGNGAVIGAGSIVTKDVPDYAIVVGNPAKILRYRFSQDIVEVLLEKKWWEKEKDEIINLKYEGIKEYR
ncbi:CatB-related O-acetyltransferase [uncultured Clostridium sp.]|uniref:CatB-related O-acetyltransferase n=1 Tax=uncultured Clostridium sp. TaxID=59620 RepID=UPI002624B95C|nr:CatB-related O-acetyltransferase [uncultured Clostridium sp.]